MPANDALQWFDISDFTPGQWDIDAAIGRFSAPNTAFRKLTNYFPLQSGGVRAFVKGTPIGVSGIPSIATKQCMGLFVRSNATTRPGKTGRGAAGSPDLILTTVDTSDFKPRIHRMDQSNDETTWKTPFTGSAAGSASFVSSQFAFFQRLDGTQVYLVVMDVNSVAGLWTVGYAAGTAGSAPDNVVTALNGHTGVILVNQARILVTDNNDDIIYYSDVGATTGFTSSLTVSPNKAGAPIAGMSGIEPSDILIVKLGAPAVVISGDITSTSTPVREMTDDFVGVATRQQLIHVPGGVALAVPNGGLYITDGRNYSAIGDQVTAQPRDTGHMVGAGTLGYLEGFIFAPGGYVYDTRTKAWFQQDSIADTMFCWPDPSYGEMYCAGLSNGFDVQKFTLAGIHRASAGTRSSSGVIQTVEYADKNGRNIAIREVQVFAQAFAASTFKVELIDETDSSVVTRYNTTPGARRGMLRFLFPETKSEYLSVKITPSANDGSSEAPAVERIRIGFGLNNLIR